MFSFFKRKPPAEAMPPAVDPARDDGDPVEPPPHASGAGTKPLATIARWFGAAPPAEPAPPPVLPAPPLATPTVPAVAPPPAPTPAAPVEAANEPTPEPVPDEAPEERRRWFDRLKGGLRKTGSAITQVFTGTRIDEALYEELETALLMADAGVKATEHLLTDLRRRVKEAKATEPSAVKGLLADAITDLLAPLERGLVVGRHTPTVIMVVGVNGAGKTTSIGKLTRYLADHRQKVLLAAADTFRAAAREQLAVWAQRSDAGRGAVPDAAPVEFVSQAGGDPSSVSFDAVVAGKARGCDVVIADTAGRLPTQLHLMEELKKIRRVITKAQADAPHEVLLVIDGNTGQNALMQVKAFDEALTLTGLVVTKLDGTAKGGVLAAIALWGRERAAANPSLGPVPVYFIGVGEQLEDLQTFRAREFANALLG
ncbi:MAG: signal recognition particle-docking protein FtsY [Ideonella sp.]|nr:signal recognition particle-docking protein FtsY [Ideonella sp.]